MAAQELKQGDIIWLDHDPQSGREQAGRRPALIVSNAAYYRATKGFALVCPITNTDNGFPLHVKLPVSGDTTGYVMCEQIKSLDLVSRKAKRKGRLEDGNVLWTILDIIQSFTELVGNEATS